MLELSNQRFKYLKVLELVGSNKHGKRLWLCQCDCSNRVTVSTGSLRSGNTTNCGCVRKETLSKVKTTHGERREGRYSSEYRSWAHMLDRCRNQKNKNYDYYGGRGIQVCEEWVGSFETFLKDMGRKPNPKYSLDRIDVDGDYSPKNCRWATLREQNTNTRRSIFVDYKGNNISLVEACELAGLNYRTVYCRVKSYGWTCEKALSVPVKVSKKINIKKGE